MATDTLNKRIENRANKKGAGIKGFVMNHLTPIIVSAAIVVTGTVGGILYSLKPSKNENDIPAPRNRQEQQINKIDNTVTVRTSKDSLTMRSSPSVNGAKLGFVENGTVITRVLKTGMHEGVECDVNNPKDWDIFLFIKYDKNGYGTYKLGYGFRGFVESNTPGFTDNEYNFRETDKYIENISNDPVYIRPSLDDDKQPEELSVVPSGSRVHVLAEGKYYDENKLPNKIYLIEYRGELGIVQHASPETGNRLFEEVDDIYYNNMHVNESVYINRDNVVLRDGPGDNRKVAFDIPAGTMVNVNGIYNNYYRLEYKGKIVYVYSEHVSKNPVSSYRDDIMFVGYTNESVTVETENREKVYTAGKNEVCEVIGQHEALYYVRIGGTTGYAPIDKINKMIDEESNNTYAVFDLDSQRLTIYRGNIIVYETNVKLDVNNKKGRFKVASLKYEKNFDGKYELKYLLVDLDKNEFITHVGDVPEEAIRYLGQVEKHVRFNR